MPVLAPSHHSLTPYLQYSMVCFWLLALVLVGHPEPSIRMTNGDLDVIFCDNSRSPRILSGIQLLINTRHAPGFNAFDADTPGASGGFNLEHIISGHHNPANRFSPRQGPFTLTRLPDGRSATLVRRAKDSPWAIGSTLTYTLRAPHYIDIDFSCVPRDPQRFGDRDYAVFFFANYMSDVTNTPIFFRGIASAGGQEHWIEAAAPPGHPDWNQGGTYRHQSAAPLAYDRDHNWKLNLWSYDYPRFTKPFFYGLTANGMVFMLMFDRGSSARDQIRFSHFSFQLPGRNRPAWDLQYVINRVEAGGEYGFHACLLWKPFVDAADCLREYELWTAGHELK